MGVGAEEEGKSYLVQKFLSYLDDREEVQVPEGCVIAIWKEGGKLGWRRN